MLRFFLVLVIAVPAFAQTPLAPSSSRIWAQPLVLPAVSTFIKLEPASDDPRAVYIIKRTYTPNSFVEEWTTEHATSLLTFRADGGLISEHHVNRFRQTGIDVTVDPDRKTVRTVLTKQGKVQSDKTTAINAGIALREEMNHLVVQTWRVGIHDKLVCQSLSPDGGLVGDFQIEFRQVTDPTMVSARYDYPAEFRAAFTPAQYVVADMSLTGMASLFFPHHFYLVYEEQNGSLDWVGYFGEDPKKPVFQFTPKQG